MNKTLRITLIVIGILVVAGGLVLAGAWIGRLTGYGWSQPGYWMMVPGSRSGYGTGPGMMGGGGRTPALRCGASAVANCPHGDGPGMMGGYGYSDVTPLTVDQAFLAAGKYLSSLNDPDLKIAEVMIFDNNAYVRVVEQSTGIGAFELLVDPVSQVAYPEHGPNMMWNLKYSGMNHMQMMGGGGMMSYYATNATPAAVSPEMPVTPAQALQAAQKYLDTALPGTTTAPDADPFYGYYTIDILRNGNTVGMLSVNGFSGQVFLHTWHGTFIEEKDY